MSIFLFLDLFSISDFLSFQCLYYHHNDVNNIHLMIHYRPDDSLNVFNLSILIEFIEVFFLRKSFLTLFPWFLTNFL